MAIRKIDYYVGALLSYLIKKKITPAIFDSSDFSKIIRFETDKEKYNLFVKYSGKAVQQNEDYSRWDISITPNEYEIITKLFYEDGFKNLFVSVCSSDALTQTEIVVLSFSDALNCMGQDTVNENRRLSAKAYKGSKYILCYGTALSDKQAIKTLRNIDKHF